MKPNIIVDHAWYHASISRDYFGTGVILSEDGKLLGVKKKVSFPVRRFHRRFRMSLRLFERIFWDISAREIGSKFF